MPEFTYLQNIPGRLYVIGDLHGCLAELTVLVEHLENRQKLSEQDIVVFIGDYIDRGPDSKALIEYLLSFEKKYPRTVFLKGNHEDMILSYLGLPGQMGEVWLQNGGGDCLVSYGLDRKASPEELRAVLPASHLAFFQRLVRYLVTEDFVFVHAGLDPLRSLHAQVDDDLFWIRDPFIQNIHHFDKVVFFGHTPFEDIVFHLPYKISVDTGLVFGNKLSCLEIVKRKVIQIELGKTDVVVKDFPKLK